MVFENADQYSHFELDASQLSNDVHIGVAKTGGHYDTKWEIVIGGWSGTKSVLRDRNGGDALLTVQHTVAQFNQYRSDIKLYVTDGQLLITVNENEFMKHRDSSIKKNELRYLLVSGGWGGSGTWAIKAAILQSKWGTT